ncbi:hypothetical protein GCM10023219_05930 [Stakelama sediminis]|uniref:Uncharacterized protein n=1 Tax=Stakelama sediminis TaxID=463200 RepID=A0A840YUR4_9SPHN|nr:hypothetical protein [Stakelama sediminis]MBB5717310.1 hypothetical protein [Stakelama sediminis]
MRSHLLKTTMISTALLSLTIATPGHAQLGGLLNQVKNKVEQQIRKGQDQGETTQQAGHHLTINHGFDFTAGTHPVVRSDFTTAPVGAMPKAWKTNGSGQIVTVDGVPGKWLALQPFATYKLTTPPHLPSHFTVEFDIIPAADTARDVGEFIFGFAKDNSARQYISDAYNGGAINAVDVGFDRDTTVSSSATGYHHAGSMDWSGYTNQPMHVSIDVNGTMEKVYIDHQKIGDSRMFGNEPARYFFLSAPVRYDHGASLLFGNFHIDSFS